MAALGAERGTLRAKPARTAADEARLAQLEEDFIAANWAFQRFLTALRTEFNRTPPAQEKLFSLQETQGLMADLRTLGPGTVALYTLVGDEKYRVLLITPDVQLAREVPISAVDLRRKVGVFRKQLAAVRSASPPPDPRPLAHELYQLLVGPIASDLRAAQAQTLLWSLDGVLRYLPLAALYASVFLGAVHPDRQLEVRRQNQQVLQLGRSGTGHSPARATADHPRRKVHTRPKPP